MFCPQCGHKIEIEGAKFCHNCGFGLSKVGNGEPSELKKMIDFALKDHHQTEKFSTDEIQESEREIQRPDKAQTEQSQPETVKEITPLIGKKDEWKWGWGWYILAGIVYTSMKKPYADYGIYQVILQLFAIVVALSVYYVLRRKFLKRVQILWRRSLFSGIIALMIAAITTPLAAIFVPRQTDRLTQQIQAETHTLLTHAEAFIQKDQKLWSQFIAEPKAEKEYKNNLMIIESSIPLYRTKDSMLVAVLKRIHLSMKEIYEDNIPPSWSLAFTPSDFQKLIDKAEEISRLDQLMLFNLWSYYNALLSNNNNYEQFWKGYETAQTQLNTVAQEYAALYKKFFGQNVNKSFDEYKKKYFR